MNTEKHKDRDTINPAPNSGQTAPVPLSSVPEDREAVIVGINAGHALNHRLAAMGLTPQVRLRVMHSARNGQCVVRVRDTRLVLGRGMAHKILVKII